MERTPRCPPRPTDRLAVAFTSRGGSTQPRRSQGGGVAGRAGAQVALGAAAQAHSQATQHDAPSLPLAPSGLAAGRVHQTGRSLTWSNTWLLVALYFCAMASATAFGPMNSVFQL